MEFVAKKTLTRKRCPRGQHRNAAGECVNKELLKQQRSMMPKKPRKQYTFKNRSKKQSLEQSVAIVKHTSPGSTPESPLPKPSEELLEQMFSPRPARAKVAVPSTIVEEEMHSQKSIRVPKVGEPAFNTDSVTPRTAFSKAYFTKPVTLLNKYPEDSESVSQHKLLFQVSFTSPDQFVNYVNLSKNRPKIDCFYQSLFSIGLRDVNKAKMDSVEVDEKGERGVRVTDQKEYLAKVFGLRDGQIEYVNSGEIRDSNGLFTKRLGLERIRDVLKRKLKDNHTTPLALFFYKYGKATFGHTIIAYKYRGTIYFFDPQQKGILDDKKIRSKTLTHLSKYAENSYIGGFSYFMIDELPEPREPINLTCDIPYVG